jgi:hypothetical protein
MLDINFQPESDISVTAAEKLVAEYIPYFMNAARTLSSQRQLSTLSWDAIIATTKDSLFFKANPKCLEKHTPDLICAPYPLQGSFYANTPGIEIQAEGRT